MHRIQGWRDRPSAAQGAALALGNFDGVHRGHRQVIAAAARSAAAMSVPLGVITFNPHPRRWFNPAGPPFQLTSVDQLGRILDGLGVDRLYSLPFDAQMAALSDEAFAREVLVEGLGARHVAAGFDVTFGAGRTGSPQLLRDYGRRFGFGVSIADPVVDAEGRKCSSSAVREALRAGDTAHAAELLGRPFAIEGVVVHGAKLGREMGFPTANIALEDYVRPIYGIYAARTRLADGREIPGIAYIGVRPTVLDGLEERLEVFLLDFDEDLYGQTLEVDLITWLRGDAKFASLDEMIEQMNRDVEQTRRLLMPDF